MTDVTEGARSQEPTPTFSRRTALKGGAALTASAFGLSLVGCASSASKPVSVTAKPRRGGTIRASVTGGGSSDTLDAQKGINAVDFARIPQLNEPLTAYDHNAQVVLWLAEEMTPNADATEWTIRVHDGVTFHNGKPLGAEDVIFSFQRIIDPKNPLPGASSLTPLDFNGMKQLDARTARLTCHTPFATFPQVHPGFYFYIVPVGYDPKKPIGTGPFKYEEFSPGVSSRFSRNGDYWVSGLPYIDSLEIIDSPDATTQVNGLLSHQFDAANLDSVSVVPELESGGCRVIISETGFFTPFTMRYDISPFSDVNVRQAMRLAVARPQMREAVFSGHGLLGNDVFAPFDPAYDHALPQRVQDVAQAKFLLKQAGHDSLHVQLTTSDISPGTIDAAQALAQQVSAAGINVSLQQVTPTTFFGTNYLQWTFSQDYWYYTPYLVQCSESMIKGAAFSETKFVNPRYNDLYMQALSLVDEASRADVIHEMMRIDYDEGTYIIPYFVPAIDGYGPTLRGAVHDRTGIPFANGDFKNFWLD
jgi:peptide/nickel transport system substrate-binding protein